MSDKLDMTMNVKGVLADKLHEARARIAELEAEGKHQAASIAWLERRVLELEDAQETYERLYVKASERLSNVQSALDGKYDQPEAAE